MSTESPDAESEEQSEEQSPGGFEGIIDSATFEAALDALQCSMAEARFEFAEDGLVAHGVDPGDVFMSEVELPADVWESYEATGFNCGIRLEKLENMVTGDGLVELSWDRDTHKLYIQSGPIEGHVGVMEPDEVRTQRPDEDVWNNADAEWTMPISDLKTALGATNPVGSDVAEFELSDEFFGILKSGDTDSVRAEFEEAEIEELDGPVHVLQSQDYLGNVKSTVPKGAELRMLTATEWPLVMEYDIEGVSVTFVQAPRLPKS